MKQEEYKAGKWYFIDDKDPHYKYIFKCGDHAQIIELYFWDGSTLEAEACSTEEGGVLATTYQIETCLKAYAEKNGYIEGAGIICFDEKFTIEGGLFYHECIDCLAVTSDGAGAWVYRDGKWAEIVSHAPSIQDKQDEELTKTVTDYAKEINAPYVQIVQHNYGTLDKTKLDVRGEMISIQELIDGYQKYLDIKTIIG